MRFDFLPTQFLTKSQPRLLPIGGGLALVDALAAEAEKSGVTFVYETDGDAPDTGRRRRGRRRALRSGRAREPLNSARNRRAGLRRLRRQRRNADTLHRPARSLYLRPICRGGYYNKGEGIRMALDIGARRAAITAAIMRNRSIRVRAWRNRPCSFFRTASSSTARAGASPTKHRDVDACTSASHARSTTSERDRVCGTRCAPHPHPELQARDCAPISHRSRRNDRRGRVEARRGSRRAGSHSRRIQRGCRQAEFKPLVLDGLATQGVTPPKSNWAHPLTEPRFTPIRSSRPMCSPSAA